MSDLPALRAPGARSTPTLGRPAPPAATTERRAALRRWWRRRPVNKALVLLHRWPSLVLGLLLVLECTSGAVLLYHGELFRAGHGSLYHHTASAHPIQPDQAITAVRAAEPGFDASWVATDDGVYAVGDATYRTVWFVDPGTGHVNGSADTEGGILGFLVNLHDCAFSCAGYPAYASWMADPVWSGGPTFLTGITWGGLVLGVLGLLTILLVATGIKIWWPGVKRLRSRFTVRTDRGRFARDYDLHNVIAAV
ncbi:MAG: PepSY domain-containing protein, partial [Actinobacteria bacterium]|nr:PepSY domain-containing protein [Actinomycetota bacterium]